MTKKVNVYSTPTCPWCHRLKDWLKAHKIQFNDLDVAENEEARNEMLEKSGQMGVPVTIIDDEKVIIGFDEDQLKKELGL